MPAASRAATIERTCCSVNWWRLACEPSRRHVSVTRTSSWSEKGISAPRPSDLFAHLRRRRGHDVEVAGVRRQVVAGPFDLDEDRHPATALVVVELGLGGQAVAGNVALHAP